MRRRHAVLALLLAASPGLSGCSDDAGEATLSPPRPRPAERPAPPVGVVIDERLGMRSPWTFQAPPTWRAVDNGTAPGRIVTYRVSDGAGPEVALSTAGGSVAANVDRWRSQVGLPMLGEAAAAALPRKPFAGRDGVYVELRSSDAAPTRLLALLLPLPPEHPTGNLALKLMGPADVVDAEEARFLAFAASLRSRFVPALSAPASAPTDPSAASGEVVVAGGYRIRVPRGWTQGPAKPLRFATLYVGGRKDLELTFHEYGAVPGGVLLNVNRWRGQMGLDELSDEGLERLPRLPMLGGQAVVLDVAGRLSDPMRGVELADAGMLAVVLERGDRMLFLKLTGPRADVAAARRDVEALCRSLEAAP